MADAEEMLARVIKEGWLQAHATIGLFPASSVGDDVLIYADQQRETVLDTLHFLRQQGARDEGGSNYSLADLIAPESAALEDYIGAFAVTISGELAQRVAEYEAQHDDYSAIMLKALADRLAEALAEHMHRRVRREFWAYAPQEQVTTDGLIREDYVGIRPAPGYPACPDHSEKATLFRLLSATENIGVTLTENWAMDPASSVCGYYFSHPEGDYFSLGKISDEQVADYARRKGIGEERAAQLLAANLS